MKDVKAFVPMLDRLDAMTPEKVEQFLRRMTPAQGRQLASEWRAVTREVEADPSASMTHGGRPVSTAKMRERAADLLARCDDAERNGEPFVRWDDPPADGQAMTSIKPPDENGIITLECTVQVSETGAKAFAAGVVRNLQYTTKISWDAATARTAARTLLMMADEAEIAARYAMAGGSVAVSTGETT